MLTRQAFWYLRHGETNWNVEGRSQGNVEVPLNPRGRAQARDAGAALLGRGIRSVGSSPLARARDTAEIVAGALGLAVEVEPELHEVAFGAKEGQPMGAWYDEWLAGSFAPPGAESFAALRVRAAAAVNRALRREPPVLVVAHGTLFRALRAEMGLSVSVRTPNGLPLLCTPGEPRGAPQGEPQGEPWTLTALGEYPGAAAS